MTTAGKKLDTAEHSIVMRVLCCLLSLLAISCGFVFGKAPVPVLSFNMFDGALLVVSVWLCIGGSIASYHYREKLPQAIKMLLHVGAFVIAINLARELWIENQHAQQFTFIYPLVNALIATTVLCSFELRTRNDILSNSAFGLALMASSGLSGRSILFGACVLLYMVLGAALLCLVARSSSSDSVDVDKRMVRVNTRGVAMPALVFSVMLLPVLSLAAFSCLPRLDAEADRISTQVRSFVTETVYKLRSYRIAQGSGGRGTANVLMEANPNKKAPKRDKSKSGKGAEKPKPADSAKQDKKNSPKLDQLRVERLPAEKPNPIAGAPAKTNAPPKQPPPPPDNDQAQQPPVPTPRPGVAPPAQPAPTPPAAGRSPSKPAASRPAGQPPPKPSPDAPVKSLNPKSLAQGQKGQGGEAQSARPARLDDKSVEPKKEEAEQKANEPEKPKQKLPEAGKAKESDESKTGTESKASPDPELQPPKPDKPSATGQPDKTSKSAAPKPSDNTFIDLSDFSVTAPGPTSEEPVFTLACNRSVYVRMATLDTFDGRSWSRSKGHDVTNCEPTLDGVDVWKSPALGVSEAMPVMELIEHFTIKRQMVTTAPTAGVPKQLSLLQAINVDSCGNLLLTSPLKKDATYTAMCDWPVVAVQDMRNARSFADRDDSSLEPFLQLPKDSWRLIDLAENIAEGGSNRFIQAENIVDFLRQNCKYSTTPIAQGTGHNIVETFLFDTKSGDCKSFATSFVMLCRSAGIPARLIAGYIPGDLDPVTGTRLYRLKHGHTWAEIYMEPYGWIAFDAVPGGMLPARPEQQYYNYQQVTRAMREYSSGGGIDFLKIIEVGFVYLGYILAALAAALVGMAAFMLWKVMRMLVLHAREKMRYRHPAMKLRDRVLKQLKTIGVVRQSSDTGGDVVRRLEEVLNSQAGGNSRRNVDLKLTVARFFDNYNEVVYGRQKDLSGLKTLTGRIESEIKSGK